MASNKSVHCSDSFAISCGTVSVDQQESKVLLIRWRKTGEIFLPKGRKNIGESLEQAAVRETLEETGYQVEILPVDMPTLATTAEGNPRDTRLITEPIAVSQRTTAGKLKVIFWFVARVDSQQPQLKDTQQVGEDFETVWATLDDGASLLTFDDDRKIYGAALRSVFKT